MLPKEIDCECRVSIRIELYGDEHEDVIKIDSLNRCVLGGI